MSQNAASTNSAAASRAAAWNSRSGRSAAPKARATQWKSGGSYIHSRPEMRGTRRSPLVAMPCTMPRPSASCDFHRSCPMPGRTKRTAMRASAAEGSGSARDGSRGGMPRRLLRLLGVAALELLDAARGVDDLLLAGVVRVGLGGDLDLDDRVLLAVGPLHQLAALGVDGRAGEEGVVRAGVEEDHRLVFGVGARFHDGGAFREGADYTSIFRAVHLSSVRGSGSPAR